MVVIVFMDFQSTRARLCLRAAEELDKQKKRNQDAIDAKKKEIERGLDKLEGYRSKCALRNVGYYDAFKISKDKDDFEANVIRLELAGIWDEVIEMLKRCELPDEFPRQKEWVDLGTRYRRIVEPLDIANYYRHLKNEDTGPYMSRGRPTRYKCTQKWREQMMNNESLESCFWAEVEELCLNTQSVDIKHSIKHLLNQTEKWILDGDLGRDVLLEASTFTKLLKEFNLVHNLAFQ
uniref:Lipase-like PAD4 n=1 Tax=Rhizophora mucronata TaxID=61149 RepID=A0A2P2JMB6_RHIMU